MKFTNNGAERGWGISTGASTLRRQASSLGQQSILSEATWSTWELQLFADSPSSVKLLDRPLYSVSKIISSSSLRLMKWIYHSRSHQVQIQKALARKRWSYFIASRVFSEVASLPLAYSVKLLHCLSRSQWSCFMGEFDAWALERNCFIQTTRVFLYKYCLHGYIVRILVNVFVSIL